MTKQELYAEIIKNPLFKTVTMRSNGQRYEWDDLEFNVPIKYQKDIELMFDDSHGTVAKYVNPKLESIKLGNVKLVGLFIKTITFPDMDRTVKVEYTKVTLCVDHIDTGNLVPIDGHTNMHVLVDTRTKPGFALRSSGGVKSMSRVYDVFGSKFVKGFKGAGMCEHCSYRVKKVANTNNWLCSYYGSTCKQVSRNCAGIRSVKSN